jgi:hypothetical protein
VLFNVFHILFPQMELMFLNVAPKNRKFWGELKGGFSFDGIKGGKKALKSLKMQKSNHKNGCFCLFK